MFEDFRIAFLDDRGAIGPFMAGKDVFDSAPDPRAAVDVFATAIAGARSGSKSLNLRTESSPQWSQSGDRSVIQHSLPALRQEPIPLTSC